MSVHVLLREGQNANSTSATTTAKSAHGPAICVAGSGQPVQDRPSWVSQWSARTQAKNILLAVGTKSIVPPIEGAEHTVTSDGILDLKECPKK